MSLGSSAIQTRLFRRTRTHTHPRSWLMVGQTPCTGHPYVQVQENHLTFLSWDGSLKCEPSADEWYLCVHVCVCVCVCLCVLELRRQLEVRAVGGRVVPVCVCVCVCVRACAKSKKEHLFHSSSMSIRIPEVGAQTEDAPFWRFTCTRIWDGREEESPCVDACVRA